MVARHGPLVLGLCRRLLGNRHDAEDLFQATFLVLARRAGAIRKPQALSCWLHGVAYRLALKARAEAKRRRDRERQAPCPPESAEPDLSWREVSALIDEELQRLPEAQRLPLVLCYLEGLTQDEAAHRLGWPRGTLKRRLESGRERLRARLTRRGVTLGAALFPVALSAGAARSAAPVTLRTAAVQASLLFTSGAAGARDATRAALLAKGALQAMLTTKIKIAALLMVLLGCAATAAGLAARQAVAVARPDDQAGAPAPRPKADEQVRQDRHGDPLPEGANARLGTVRLRHPDGISPVVFTPDGKTAVVGDRTGSLVYWDVATGREARRLPQAVPNWPCTLAISADGKLLAAADRVRMLYLFDVATGKQLSRSEVPIPRNTSTLLQQILFAPDGRTLALRDGTSTLLLWDAVGQKTLHKLEGHTGALACMAFSPDGKTLVSGGENDRHVRLWDVAAGKEKLHFAADETAVRRLALSPDGKALAVIDSQWALTFYEARTGAKLRTSKDAYVGMDAIRYAPDGKTLAGIERGAVVILNAADGRRLRTFDAPPREMGDLTFSPDGKTLATFWAVLPSVGPHTFDLWDVAAGKLLHPSAGHREGVSALAFSADGRTVFSTAGPVDGVLWTWDAASGEAQGQIGGAYQGLNGVALSPDGKLLAVCDRTGLPHLWDARARKEVRACKPSGPFIPLMGGFSSVAWSSDGRALVSNGYADKTVRVWDAATGKQRQVIEAGQDFIARVALSPDGATVAAGGYADGTIRLWSAATGKELRRIATPPRDPGNGEFPAPRRRLAHSMVSALAFGPGGSVLASGGDTGQIYLWEAATGRPLRGWDTKAGWVGQLAFSRDGRTLLTGHADSRVYLWEAATGQERACFTGHRGPVLAVAFAPDGRSVASGGEDTTTLLWDATGGTRPDVPLSAERLRALWADLEAADARQAHRALWQLARAPKQALPFLTERLRPLAAQEAAGPVSVERLLADLDSDSFAVREKAEAELTKWGPSVERALRKALEGQPSPEVRRRVESVLAKIAVWSGERLRALRALEAIESMNTPEAGRLLSSLTDGAPRSWLAEQARLGRVRVGR
ncbi:MAG TPA: sigma-70 family RNA polymerase sigma factor [Gemmataceae bacterium]|nr:sigma-70 family RNA polymerase sigma factor [Gemmataceae bacterium]